VSDSYDDLIDQAYNVRRALPDHPAHFVRWREEADQYLASRPDALVDLAYGPHPKHRLDWFPAWRTVAEQHCPIVLLIHGGYWQALDKADNRQMARALNAIGFGVAVLNYRLCPEVGIEDITHDVGAATAWLMQRANQLGADPKRLAVVGHSAGAHLAAMLACQSSQQQQSPRFPIAYLGLVSGVYDLAPLCRTPINDKLALDEAQANALSPSRLRPPESLVVDTFVGEHETRGFFQQQQILKTAWGDRVQWTGQVITATDHLSVWDQLTETGTQLSGQIITTLQRLFPELQK